jgi:hypothetical protein
MKKNRIVNKKPAAGRATPAVKALHAKSVKRWRKIYEALAKQTRA